MKEKKLVISFHAKSCERGEPMRASGVAATFWAEGQVRAGEEPTGG